MNGYELKISWEFKAPLEAVYKMWIDMEHFIKWWSPKGFEMEVHQFEFQPDGILLYSQTSPDGQKLWGKFVYEEMIQNEKLSFRNAFSDEEGRTVRAPFSSTWPLEIYNTLTFEENGGHTIMKVIGVPVNASEEELETFKAMHENIKKGFAGTFDQLDTHLAERNEM